MAASKSVNPFKKPRTFKIRICGRSGDFSKVTFQIINRRSVDALAVPITAVTHLHGSDGAVLPAAIIRQIFDLNLAPGVDGEYNEIETYLTIRGVSRRVSCNCLISKNDSSGRIVFYTHSGNLSGCDADEMFGAVDGTAGSIQPPPYYALTHMAAISPCWSGLVRNKLQFPDTFKQFIPVRLSLDTKRFKIKRVVL